MSSVPSGRILRKPLLCIAVLLAMSPAARGAQPGDVAVAADYDVSYAGLPIAELSLEARVGAGRYAVEGEGRTAGAPMLFFNFEGRAQSQGRIGADAMAPERHESRYEKGSRAFSTRMTFDGNGAQADLDPPLKAKRSRVPLEPEHRRGVIDPLSAVVVPAEDADLVGPEACRRNLPVFDGRERYDVRLSFARTETVQAEGAVGYSGPVTVCRAEYIPVAGHRRDLDDWAAMVTGKNAAEIWLAPVEAAGALVLYRAKVPTAFGPVTVAPTRFDVTGPERQAKLAR
jgi:hypothetical protein